MAKLTYMKGHDPVKFCPSCKEYSTDMWEILRMWAKNPTKADGLEVYCRECKRKWDRERYLARKEWAGVERLRKWMGEGLDEIRDPEAPPPEGSD